MIRCGDAADAAPPARQRRRTSQGRADVPWGLLTGQRSAPCPPTNDVGRITNAGDRAGYDWRRCRAGRLAAMIPTRTYKALKAYLLDVLARAAPAVSFALNVKDFNPPSELRRTPSCLSPRQIGQK